MEEARLRVCSWAPRGLGGQSYIRPASRHAQRASVGTMFLDLFQQHVIICVDFV